ncbi:MAG: Nif3-like dinuclear metal center hexameric protein [endosymbiont of Galathealinum brachiosum]|uniref:GTP cyclohydrolase 1 type 2 homolog n=1 Tax=endosymbiont of Galathealinum brachiosum TaxID=2200906 RepID=A0A370DAF9_9GAMM|nr:MAG: Nif3-like dinuclear metal center hexameric protein [endosymbiont of Galathealinum brachiosum]
MAQLNSIVEYCNDLLQVNEFSDYCPNGLQVEGFSEVNRIICGVTACQDLIEAAIEKQANVLLVHHGYFWKNEDAVITGIKRKRIQRLLEHGISLLAYHLPLDAHQEFGNNATLAQQLDINIGGCVMQGPSKGLLWNGELESAVSATEFALFIEKQLKRKPLHLSDASNKTIKTLGWCTGGAQHYIEDAAAMGLDAFISGEVSEQTFHLAKELDIHYFAAGHHATESYGVQALAEHLSEKFKVSTEFVDILNPV